MPIRSEWETCTNCDDNGEITVRDGKEGETRKIRCPSCSGKKGWWKWVQIEVEN